MSSAAILREELIRIGDIITAAHDMVADGQLINVNPLENEVTRICGNITNLTGPEAAMLKPVLLSLMDDLDRLAEEMRVRQTEFEGELRTLSSHTSAARAYGANPNGAANNKK